MLSNVCLHFLHHTPMCKLAARTEQVLSEPAGRNLPPLCSLLPPRHSITRTVGLERCLVDFRTWVCSQSWFAQHKAWVGCEID